MNIYEWVALSSGIACSTLIARTFVREAIKKPILIEQTPFDEPFMYTVHLTECTDKGVVRAIRRYDTGMTLMFAKHLMSQDVVCLCQDVSARDVDRLVSMIKKYSPTAKVEISCNKFPQVYSLSGWRGEDVKEKEGNDHHTG